MEKRERNVIYSINTGGKLHALHITRKLRGFANLKLLPESLAGFGERREEHDNALRPRAVMEINHVRGKGGRGAGA